MKTTNNYDRQLGSFIGLAVSDALGTTLEFCKRDSKPHHTEMTGGGYFGLPAGCFTDDTSMALALADSLANSDDFNPKDLMDRFVDWYKNGAYSPTGECVDIGNATREALEKYMRDANPNAGSENPHTSGNGSLMRVAPVAIKYFDNIPRAIEIAKLQSMTTHGSRECIAACQYFTILLCEAISVKQKEEILRNRPFIHSSKVNEISQGSYKAKKREQIISSGYVITSLEAAIWAVYNTESFEDAVILAVNLGNDADTVGAITGQLAGAIYGHDAIPKRWLNKMDKGWLSSIETSVLALAESK